MTPITTHEGRQVVRGSFTEPTPFLVSMRLVLRMIAGRTRSEKGRPPRAIDVGCGNGRNSEWLKREGWDVLSFDLKPDYGHPLDLTARGLPVFSRDAELVLLQFVLMFLDDDAIARAWGSALSAVASPGMIVVEMAAVKSSLHPRPRLAWHLGQIAAAGRMVFPHSRRSGLRLAMWS